MSVSISTYAGRLGWMARKYFPFLSSNAYLKLQYVKRRKISQEYIDYFCDSKKKPQPLNILIETINRCNSTCSFCAANRNDECRPFCRMEEDLFKRIISQIADWDYSGYISLFANNEPFMDTRIIDFHRYIREKLPNARIKVFTNGLLLDCTKFKEIAPYADLFIINNYCDDRKLHPNIEELYQYLKKNPAIHEKIDVQIKIRYIGEVLTNRAGTSPNKKETKSIIKEPCLFPYTDMVIYPDGKAGICCCDVKEVTDLGNVNQETIQEIWTGKKYESLRRKLRDGRQENKFCEHCDFVDTGLRVKLAKKINEEMIMR